MAPKYTLYERSPGRFRGFYGTVTRLDIIRSAENLLDNAHWPGMNQWDGSTVGSYALFNAPARGGDLDYHKTDIPVTFSDWATSGLINGEI